MFVSCKNHIIFVFFYVSGLLLSPLCQWRQVVRFSQCGIVVVVAVAIVEPWILLPWMSRRHGFVMNYFSKAIVVSLHELPLKILC